MLNSYVAVDIETTGLNASRDSIIEVAAITFQGNEIVDEFSSLVYPQCDIPAEITRLTGITQAMVQDAPGMVQVRSRLRPILSNHIVVGHNVDFDMSFLREERLAIGNHRIDTLTLASILIPEAGRFGLAALADFLYLPMPEGGQAHRAREDAELTIELFLALRERALQMFFEEVLAERARKAFTGDELRQRGRLPKLFKPPKLEGRAVVAKEKLVPLDEDVVAGMIQPGGNFSHVFEGFEHRPEQEEMTVAVAQAFNDGDHVLIEAGTGTGKSIGYKVCLLSCVRRCVRGAATICARACSSNCAAAAPAARTRWRFMRAFCSG
jgi:DNA polymerase-3 subunit epsilon/ATP-dependent DNA helicase DinG